MNWKYSSVSFDGAGKGAENIELAMSEHIAVTVFCRFADFVGKKSKSWHCQCDKSMNKKKHGISQSIEKEWIQRRKISEQVDKSDMNSFKCVFSASSRDS